ncbi:MAG: hypothetical protein R2710_13445 [Acidimicrobiales bacterium]
MRAIRLVLGMALLAMVVAVWQRRDPIIEAYTEERAPVQFEFDGLDFEVSQQVDLGSSPLIVPAAPDTKNVVLPTLLAADSIAEATLPSGSVELSGVVTDALGPVPFAIVRVEHHAAGSSDGAPVVATLDITCDDVGRWQLTGVGGGRWRIEPSSPSNWRRWLANGAFRRCRREGRRRSGGERAGTRTRGRRKCAGITRARTSGGDRRDRRSATSRRRRNRRGRSSAGGARRDGAR